MNYTLGYVVGNDPAKALEYAGFGGADKSGQPSWSALARKSKRHYSGYSVPKMLVLRDGTLISEDEVGEDTIREIFGTLDEQERITVVALRS